MSALAAVFLIFGLQLALTRRMWTTVSATLYLMLVVLIASWIQQKNQGMAMTLGDVGLFFRHPVENFKLFIKYPRIGAAFLAICGGAAGIFIAGIRREQPTRRALAATIAMGLGLLIAFARPVSSDVKAHGDAYAAWQSMTEMLQPTGWTSRLNVFFENWDSAATIPARRQQSRFKQTRHAAPTAARRAEFPDILMVFEESTFDPTTIDRCSFPECDNAMLHALPFATSTQEGPLITHTTGGGSWLTEFAFLAGFDWRVFGRGGRLAPISLAPRVKVSLPKRLRALGYRTVAIYPSEGEFLGAKTAYSHYDFDEFHDARELQLNKGWFETRDSMIFEKALAAAEHVNDPRPVFLLVLTIRNHGPYRSSVKTLPGLSSEFTDHLLRMQDSSRDYVELAEQWLRSPRPRVLGWFGDHQPEPAWAFVKDRFVTHYQLSSNRPNPAPLSEPKLDVSYLGDVLMAFSGLPLDDAADAALKMAAQCKGLMFECPDHELVQDYLSFRIHELQAIR